MVNKEKKLAVALVMGLILLTQIVAGFSRKGFFGDYLGDILREPRILASNLVFLQFARVGHGTLYAEFVKLITMNPSVSGNILLQTFVKLIIPFYALSIAGIGFYLIFQTGSPEKRANAKSMLGKLVMGMIIISLSPQLLEVGLDLSQNLTYQILNSTDVELCVGRVRKTIDDFSDMYWSLGQLNPTFGFIFPGLWLHYFGWGIFAIIAIRYLLVTLWIGLFPLTVFFYSFRITRTLGKNMMEQTILWTALQAFNASVVVAVALSTIPGTSSIAGAEEMFHIAHFGNFMIIMGAAIIVIAPIMATRLFRNFLPG